MALLSAPVLLRLGKYLHGCWRRRQAVKECIVIGAQSDVDGMPLTEDGWKYLTLTFHNTYRRTVDAVRAIIKFEYIESHRRFGAMSAQFVHRGGGMYDVVFTDDVSIPSEGYASILISVYQRPDGHPGTYYFPRWPVNVKHSPKFEDGWWRCTATVYEGNRRRGKKTFEANLRLTTHGNLLFKEKKGKFRRIFTKGD